MNLNLEGQTPLEIFGVDEERIVGLQGEFDKVINSEDSFGDFNVNKAISLAKELAQTDEEFGLLLINIGRNIGTREMLDAFLGSK